MKYWKSFYFSIFVTNMAEIEVRHLTTTDVERNSILRILSGQKIGSIAILHLMSIHPIKSPFSCNNWPLFLNIRAKHTQPQNIVTDFFFFPIFCFLLFPRTSLNWLQRTFYLFLFSLDFWKMNGSDHTWRKTLR